MPSRRWPALLGVALFALVAWGGWSLALEQLARWAGSQPDTYLRPREEWLQVLDAENYEGRGEGRVLVLGPSEVREGVLVDQLSAALPRRHAYMNALSMGTLADVLVLLDFVKAEHGASAMPDQILLGVTTRFLLNKSFGAHPFLNALDRYSSSRVNRESHPPSLEPKGPLAALAAKVRWQTRQARHYRMALRATSGFALTLLGNPQPELAADLLPPRYHSLPPRNKEPFRRWARTGTKANPDAFYFYEGMRDMDPICVAPMVRSDFAALRERARLMGTSLFVVNLPEGSWAEDFYAPGRYDDYWRLLQDVAGDQHLLDLHDFLADEEFHDWNHPTRAGAERITERLIHFLTHRGGPQPETPQQ